MKWKGKVDFDVTPQVVGTDVSIVGHTHPITPSDQQSLSSTSYVSTTSTIYVILPNTTLTTKNLGETGSYILMFTCVTYGFGPTYINYFRFNIGGTPSTDFWLNANDKHQTFTMITHAIDVASGTSISVEYKSSSGFNNVQVENREIVIRGVPSSGIVT